MLDYVLSNKEIVRLKHYIEHKHQNLDPMLRTAILSDAVHRVIESRLPSFTDEVKQQVRHELLLKNRDSLVIHVDDVLQHCMSLDLSQEELLSSLAEWVCSKSNLPVQSEVVQQILLKWSQEPKTSISLEALEREWDRQELITYEEIAITSESMIPYGNKSWPNRKTTITIVSFFAVILSILLIKYPVDQESSAPEQIIDPVQRPQTIIQEPQAVGGIPKDFKYVAIDTKRLKQYLLKRDSMLAEESYMSAIVEASKKYDIHPLLLFAITGQEQGFVPKDHKRAEEIVNNPFNVFGSWESYNTTIDVSANIAAKTVVNVMGRRPGSIHPIKWLNLTYAEDPNWWEGVTWFFDDMKQKIEDESFEWP